MWRDEETDGDEINDDRNRGEGRIWCVIQSVKD